MKKLIYLAKVGMMTFWLLTAINAIWPYPAPYNQLSVLLFQATVVGHVFCCFGFRARQKKPLTWLIYQDILLFGVFAILGWRYAEQSDAEQK